MAVKLSILFSWPFSEHQYKASAPGPENERTMVFFNVARVDGLSKRTETPTEMTEHYVDRDDFLYFKHIIFGKRPKKFGPQEEATTVNPRPIVVSKNFIFLFFFLHFLPFWGKM